MTLSGLSPPAIGPDLDAPQAPTTRSTHFSIRNIRIIRKIHPLRTILRIVRILRIRGSRAKRMNRSLALIRPGRLPREQSLRELSALLARGYLWRRLAWRVQELAYGGLSERAKARIADLNREDDLRFLPPRGWSPSTVAAPAPTSGQDRAPVRDPRLPAPGAILIRQYHGQEIRVTVLEKGFEYQGRPYRSLSAVAHAVT